jgi:CRISPR-associated protein Csb3
MSGLSEPAIRIRVDPANPGQFFACCGLLELADRLWGGVEGWFEKDEKQFTINAVRSGANKDCTPANLLGEICRTLLTNSMTESQLKRREQLLSMTKKTIESSPSLEAEKKMLDKLWRESPILLNAPLNLCLDWFMDERSGGATFKTWAGQQSVFEIARGMKNCLEPLFSKQSAPHQWLSAGMLSDSLPFNFDSDLGGVGSDCDVGFSFDPLKTVKVQTRPLIEFFAFVGLQRFRPRKINTENRYRYFLWFDPLVPEIAATATCGLLGTSHVKAFDFRLLYRTKYLKSFMPANPIERS